MKRNNNCYAIKLSAIEVKSSGVGKHEFIHEFLGKYSKHIKNAISFLHKDIAQKDGIDFLPLYFASLL